MYCPFSGGALRPQPRGPTFWVLKGFLWLLFSYSNRQSLSQIPNNIIVRRPHPLLLHSEQSITNSYAGPHKLVSNPMCDQNHQAFLFCSIGRLRSGGGCKLDHNIIACYGKVCLLLRAGIYKKLVQSWWNLVFCCGVYVEQKQKLVWDTR